MSGLLSGTPNTSCDSSSSPTSSFFKFLTFITGIVMLRLFGAERRGLRIERCDHSSYFFAQSLGLSPRSPLLRLLNQHVRAVRAGQCAANHEQVVFGINRHH